MRRKTTEVAEAPFLDVVTNLIGILIIIIMVTGPRATDAIVEAVVKAKKAQPAANGARSEQTAGSPTVDVAAAKAAADAVEKGIHEIDDKLREQQLEIEYRRNERDKILALLTSVEQALGREREQLTTAQQKQLDSNRELLAARSELEELRDSRRTLENSPATPNVIENQPTPLAKAVFGQEVHFRLQGGRLAYVPWDEFVEALKADVPTQVWKLKDSARITETLGVIRGFRMEYALRRGGRLSSIGGAAVAVSPTVELERFVLVPVSDDLGEPVDQVFQEKSELRAILSRYDGKRASVTIWVYPDSFGQFRALKSKLLEMGFLTSARPMPAGHPIGGSPEGSRSAAE